jgi:hypothetical protein
MRNLMPGSIRKRILERSHSLLRQQKPMAQVTA